MGTRDSRRGQEKFAYGSMETIGCYIIRFPLFDRTARQLHRPMACRFRSPTTRAASFAVVGNIDVLGRTNESERLAHCPPARQQDPFALARQRTRAARSWRPGTRFELSPLPTAVLCYVEAERETVPIASGAGPADMHGGTSPGARAGPAGGLGFAHGTARDGDDRAR
jgi:hypothetical protein